MAYSNLSMNLLIRMSSFINVSSLSKKLYCSPNGGNVHVLGVRQQFGIDNRVLPFATPSATVDLGCKRLFSAPHKCMHCTSARGGHGHGGGPAIYACAVIFCKMTENRSLPQSGSWNLISVACLTLLSLKDAL